MKNDIEWSYDTHGRDNFEDLGTDGKVNMKKNLKDTQEVGMDCIRLAGVAVLEKICEHSN
jgi:hypothetical protein